MGVINGYIVGNTFRADFTVIEYELPDFGYDWDDITQPWQKGSAFLRREQHSSRFTIDTRVDMNPVAIDRVTLKQNYSLLRNDGKPVIIGKNINPTGNPIYEQTRSIKILALEYPRHQESVVLAAGGVSDGGVHMLVARWHCIYPKDTREDTTYQTIIPLPGS